MINAQFPSNGQAHLNKLVPSTKYVWYSSGHHALEVSTTPTIGPISKTWQHRWDLLYVQLRPLKRGTYWNVRMVVKPDGAGLFRCAWTFAGNYVLILRYCVISTEISCILKPDAIGFVWVRMTIWWISCIVLLP